MKKALRILLIVLIIIVALAAAFLIMQRKNISMLYTASTHSEEEIADMQQKNTEKLIESVNGYLDYELREPTIEETEKIKNGELDTNEFYRQVINEHLQETREDKKTNDYIVSKYISELYALQSSYTSRAEGLIAEAAAQYKELRVGGKSKEAASAEIISKYMSNVRSVQAQCDTDVERVITQMESELKKIGSNLDIISTARATYESEKKLALSRYASKYVK